MIEILNCNANLTFWLSNGLSVPDLIEEICEKTHFSQGEFYLLSNGKLLEANCNNILENVKIDVVPRFLGGKGGFGSMLRAIGAQIEKTTNREACRDLSGRRLRDINEEKRLKNWIDQQAEREKTALDKRQKKLERLTHKPKHEFKDEKYEKERSALPEKLEDALSQGLQATGEASTSKENKRKLEPEKDIKKKKPKLWIDDDIEVSDSDVECSEDEIEGEIKNEETKECSEKAIGEEIKIEETKESTILKT